MDVVNIIPKDRLLIESDGPYSKVNGKKFDEVQFRSKVRGWGTFYVVVVVA